MLSGKAQCSTLNVFSPLSVKQCLVSFQAKVKCCRKATVLTDNFFKIRLLRKLFQYGVTLFALQHSTKFFHDLELQGSHNLHIFKLYVAEKP